MRFLLAILCVLLASAVVRLGWAEVVADAHTSAALERAAGIEGGWNAARWEDLAEASGADTVRARGWLRRATTASPRQVSSWLARGLRAESAGDFGEADYALKEAARLDRQYLPAWTLANFYFRRGNPEAFWPWAQRAAHMTYDDFRPLFRLCDGFEPDASAVMNRLGGERRPGDERRMLRAYVTYLAGERRRLDAAELAGRRLLVVKEPADRPVFINLITREISANRAAQALAFWSAVATPLDPRNGPVLSNGDFRDKPTGEGFDWSMPACAGLVSEWQLARVAFNLSGRQPDDCILLDQAIPVAHGRRYRLHFESTRSAPDFGAVGWEVTGRAMAMLGPGDSFRAPADALIRLRLVCRRAPGTIPFEGRIEIRNVGIEVE